MFGEVFLSVLITLWIIFSVVLYSWHYFIEVILDLPITGQSPCTAHASLKQLVQRIIQEALGLPILSPTYNHLENADATVDRSYEDLLATAILNKVIQSYQDELPSSSKHSVSSRLSTSSRQSHNTNKEYFFGEENLSTKWKNNPLSNDEDSNISLEEWVQSSPGSLSQFDQIEIRQEIEAASSSDDAEPQYIHTDSLLKSNGYSDEWQENWLMQKRKLNGTASPVPVPMLVPNPNEEAKVKIGDKEAEETSDLSDVGSDFGEVETSQDIKMILVDSKTVIGGKNLLDKVNLSVDSVSDDDSTDVSDLREEKEDVINRFMANGRKKSLRLCEGADIGDQPNSYTSLESNIERDTEYTERYASLPRTKVKSPEERKGDHIRDETATDRFPYKNQKGKVFEENNNETNENLVNGQTRTNNEEEGKLFKGSYAEREKNKWHQQAVELKNNPYSEENLQRRLSNQSTNSSGSLFGRDYYIRQASRSAGATKSKKEKISYDHQFSSPELKPEENDEALCNGYHSLDLQSSNKQNVSQLCENIVEVDGQSSELIHLEESKLDVRSSEVLDKSTFPKNIIENCEIKTQNLNQSIAIPVEATNAEILVKYENSDVEEQNSFARPTSLEISSDSDKSLERVYNVETGRVMVRVGDRIKELEEENKSPECISYITKPFDFKTETSKVIVDQNHNIEPNLETITHVYTNVNNNDVPFTKTSGRKIRKQIYSHFLSHSPINVKSKLFEEELHMEGEKENVVSKGDSYTILGPQSSSSPINSNGDINEFSLEYSTDNENYSSLAPDRPSDEINSLNMSKTHSTLDTDTEISEIRNKKLVKSLLGEFLKIGEDSCTQHTKNKTSTLEDEIIKENKLEADFKENKVKDQCHIIETLEKDQEQKLCNELDNVEIKSTTESHIDEKEQQSLSTIMDLENNSIETDEFSIVPSVQHLKKMFDKSNSKTKLQSKTGTNKPVYSLTARSIPVEVRQELKNSVITECPNQPDITKEEVSLCETIDSDDDAEDLSFPTAKSKIQFFESLKY